jgi:EAL domain-containing protein (putative c-di-GMP-specific phosphodiesterase class I)/GGDEF domain-containing protein
VRHLIRWSVTATALFGLIVLSQTGLLPRFGMVHSVSAVPVSDTAGLIVTALLALFLLLRSPPFPSIALVLITTSAAGEALSALAHREAGIILSTASLHAGMLLLFALALMDLAYSHLKDRYAALARLKYLATHDADTGLLSRQGLIVRPEPAYPLALVLLEIQATDELRAMLGHEVAEALVVRFATRLSHAGYTEVARVASATFALIRRDEDAEALAASARHLATTLSGAYQVDEHSLHIDVVAGYAAGTSCRSTLLSQAEIALIQARGDHMGVRGFSPADQHALDRRRRLDRDLRQAIDRQQLRLLYQPQVDLRSRRIIGAEALIRWDHPEFGEVSPTEFIPLSEETGQILDLGRWALGQACRQAVAWPVPITIAVNVSPLQFQHSDVPAVVNEALRQSGLPAARLELEITEGSRITDPKRIHDLMWSLDPLGIRLSVDDFGTGYSSLSYFRDFPFHTVKIDQAFVRDRASRAHVDLLAAIIELARKMGKQTVAEGIEDETTASVLAAMGCTYGQGYHFGRPMSDQELTSLLSWHWRRRAL